MKIKIISEGYGTTTRIVNADSGELVEGVISVSWKCSSLNDPAYAILKIINVPVEVIGTVKEHYVRKPD